MGEAIAQIVVGLIELLFGRRLFWVFVAAGGFLFGWFVAPAIWENIPDWTRIVVGVVLGLILAGLAKFFTRAMVAVGGFLIFGPATVVAVDRLGGSVPQGSNNYWIAFAVGGVVGAVLLGIFFNWALIILSSLVGAGATVAGIEYFTGTQRKWLEWVLLIVLLVIGLVFQIKSFFKHKDKLIGLP
jgi:Domain of unknown function (DUF4203)